MAEKKDNSKEEDSTPRTNKAEGVLESVGVQGATLYLMVDGKRIDVAQKQKIKVEVLK